MLYKSNVVALLGGGKTPKYTPNKIVLWDDSQVKVITEIRLGFDVICVKLKKEKYRAITLGYSLSARIKSMY